MRHVRRFCLLWLFLHTCAMAAPIAPDRIPEALRPWVPWVLHGVEERLCIALPDDPEQRRCAWPEPLELRVQERSGTFLQTWVLDTETWVELPGGSSSWPQEVTLDGRPASVLNHDERPALRAGPGRHELRGKFFWSRPPESLPLPAGTGLQSLYLHEVAQTRPRVDADGNLWLSGAGGTALAAEQDHLEAEIFRRLTDEVPLQVTTLVRLRSAGRQREFNFPSLLLPNSIPLRIDSPLPTRLENDGRIRVLLRPGTWELTLTARLPGATSSLTAATLAEPWPAEEVWSFEAHNELRAVSIDGVPSVDPVTAQVPAPWQRFPAYQVHAGAQMSFRVERRGNPDPTPDALDLRRSLWLDFDGQGYTVSDQITGKLSQSWRLDAGPELDLGQVLIDGQPQLITHLRDPQQAGVEIRQGRLNVSAEGRFNSDRRTLPALGWQHDFRSVQTTLNLPPGWRLFAASGVDKAAGAWVDQWSFLDMFLVMITAYAARLLWGVQAGLLVAITLISTWHEPQAPAWIWLGVIVMASFLRILAGSRLQRLAQLGYYLSLATLAAIAIPFLIAELRTGLYPQLAMPSSLANVTTPAPTRAYDEGAGPAAEAPEVALADTPSANSAPAAPPAKQQLAAKTQTLQRSDALRKIDPGAKIQTGPGLPAWHWQALALYWNGPVEQQQTLRLLLLSPRWNLLLNILRVVLVVSLATQLLRFAPKLPASQATRTSPLLLLAGILCGLPWSTSGWAQLPDAALLEQLQGRLLLPPACAPRCADISRAHITIQGNQLLLRLDVSAGVAAAIPIPGHAQQWAPEQVLNGRQAVPILRNTDGTLLARVEAGRHTLALLGSVRDYATLQLPLPLPPHQITVAAPGWQVEGLREDGSVAAELRFTRTTPSALADLQQNNTDAIPGFARVERTLQLDQDWQVLTRLTRLAPVDHAITFAVPLVPGESVLSPGIEVKDGKALISLEAGNDSASWQSSLRNSAEIQLTASPGTELVEVWRLAAGTFWHVETSGLSADQELDTGAQRRPEWHPWPGENLHISVSRPEPQAGATLTIDSSRLTVSPGLRATDHELNLRLRSSQGGQHKLRLPTDSSLLQVEINHQPQTLRLQDDTLSLPIVPGTQEIKLAWRSNGGISTLFRTPALDLNLPSVNHTIELNIGPDRWSLLPGGPPLGPAVLFWGQLIVTLVLAVALGRTALTPLKTRHWLLLGVGLSQSGIISAVLVVGWLLACGVRARTTPSLSNRQFDLLQVVMALWTVYAIAILFLAIEQGLLGSPEMQVSGNGSTALHLRWFQDRNGPVPATAWLLSLPVLVYRALMLAWATWLAAAFLHWLRWAWRSYSAQGLWRPLRSKGSNPDTGDAPVRAVAPDRPLPPG